MDATWEVAAATTAVVPSGAVHAIWAGNGAEPTTNGFLDAITETADNLVGMESGPAMVKGMWQGC